MSDFRMNGGQIKELADGVSPTDAINKGQVDTIVTNEGLARSSAMSTEAAARIAGDAANASALATETAARQAADTAEATARQTGDTNNSTAISAEASTRAAADTTNANAITAEASTRASADTTNANAITAEASARASAVSTEAAARAAADAAILQLIPNYILNGVVANGGKIIVDAGVLSSGSVTFHLTANKTPGGTALLTAVDGVWVSVNGALFPTSVVANDLKSVTVGVKTYSFGTISVAIVGLVINAANLVNAPNNTPVGIVVIGR